MTYHTYTRTFNTIEFADPYKKCLQCRGWVDGARSTRPGPLTVIPCEHQRGYRDVCPSWSPVDGCGCNPGEHEMRAKTDDGKVY